jgi:serine/threonine-protein kinase
MLPADFRSPQAEPTEVLAASPAGYEFYLKGRGYLLEYQKPENIDAAIKQFEQALKVSPNYAPAYAGLGEAYWQSYKGNRGNEWLDKAKVNCERALAAEPKLAEGHICLGGVYNETGRYDDAAKQFQQALAAEPENTGALYGLGKAFEKIHDAPAAEATYKKAIALRPQYWAVYNWLGTFYYRNARYAEAEAMFQKVNDLTPDNYRGYDNLGAMYLLEGRYDKSIKTFNRSIELKPTLQAHSNLGTAYFYLHRYSAAIAEFEKARTLDDKDYMNWGNLGDALYWSPDRRPESVAVHKQAIALTQTRLQVNPKDATAQSYLAYYSAMVMDERTATVEIKKAIQLSPQDPEVLFRAALVYNQLGEQAQTLDWLKKAVAANFSRTTVRDTPDFDHLKSNPTFQAIIAGA